LEFEKIHLNAYRKFEFNCVHIPAKSIEYSVKLILEYTND